MRILPLLPTLLLTIVLIGCGASKPTPTPQLNALLRQSVSSRRNPALGQRWLVSIVRRNNRERVELTDLARRVQVPLPGLNRLDSQPISVSINATGERIALVSQREDRTEVVLYRRTTNALQRIPLEPPGVPRAVSLDGAGRLLAVQVSRNGRWDVSLIPLP